MPFRFSRSIGAILTTNILVSVGGLLLIIATLGLTAYQLDQIDDRHHLLMKQQNTLTNLRKNVLQSVILLDRLLFLNDQEIVPKLLSVNEDTYSQFSLFQSNAEKLKLKYDVEIAREYEPVIFRFRNLLFRAVSQYREQNIDEAISARKQELDNIISHIFTFIGKSEEFRKYDMQEQGKIHHAIKFRLTFLIMALIVVVAAVSLFSNLMIRRTITRRLSELGSVTLSFAKGKLNARARIENRDEIGNLAFAFNYMATQLQKNNRNLIEESQVRLVAEKKAKKANKAKSEFLSTMSHEIRTPLNGVVGMAQLLAKTPLNSEQQTRVEGILSSSDSLLSVINNVLDMSKIETGNIEIECTPFDISETIATVSKTYEGLADEVGIEFSVVTHLENITHFKGDPARLKQILINLLGNAFKFTHEGSIKLFLSIIDHTDPDAFEGADHSLNVIIADTGKGIAPNRLPTIFQIFTQEDSSITREYGGSGLGLSIVKHLCELMGGTVTVESVVDEGTRFTVLLPFEKVTAEDRELLLKNKNPLVSQIQMKPLNVLVVEDNVFNSVIATSFLEGQNHIVSTAINGKVAVDLFAKNPQLDLIFMDYNMPDMDGCEATRRIRTMPKGVHVPIIGLTADAFAERHKELREAGMNDVLTKPFTEEQLINIILKNVSMKDVLDPVS